MVRRRRLNLHGLRRNHRRLDGRRPAAARTWGPQRLFLLFVACLTAGSGAGLVWAQGWDAERYEVDGRRSGYLYLGAQIRALQDDDFLNPGIFAVERGEELWNAEPRAPRAHMRLVPRGRGGHDARRGGALSAV